MKLLALILFVLTLAVSGSALATGQAADRLIYKDNEYPLFSNPLEKYYNIKNPRPPFQSPSTGNWRGYVATWEITNNALYLKDIRTWLPNKNEVSLAELFPGHRGPIAATWYTGTLRVPQGRLLEYVHGGYDSTYEQDLIITIEAGKVINQNVINNKKIMGMDQYDQMIFLIVGILILVGAIATLKFRALKKASLISKVRSANGST